MQILVGLGNPGQKYSNTKHNFGFWVLDSLVKKLNLDFISGKGEYIIAKQKDLLCIKPTTFMNNSGIATLEVQNYFKCKTNSILVIYDDIDLPLGMIRFKENGGSGGHKGIESIIYKLQSEKFSRLRLGIATNENMRPSEKFVLSPFSNSDKEMITGVLDRACDGISFFLSHGIKETMNKYNEKKQEIN